MSEFLLLGTRPAVPGEASLGGVAYDMAALAAWHEWLRRWGLLRSFGLPSDPAGELCWGRERLGRRAGAG